MVWSEIMQLIFDFELNYQIETWETKVKDLCQRVDVIIKQLREKE